MEAEADRISSIKESAKREKEAEEFEEEAERILGRQGTHLAKADRVQAVRSQIQRLQIPDTLIFRSSDGTTCTYPNNRPNGSPTVAGLEEALRRVTVRLPDGTTINGVERREREIAEADRARQAWRDSKTRRHDLG